LSHHNVIRQARCAGQPVLFVVGVAEIAIVIQIAVGVVNDIARVELDLFVGRVELAGIGRLAQVADGIEIVGDLRNRGGATGNRADFEAGQPVGGVVCVAF
jgi:hypothetical protein